MENKWSSADFARLPRKSVIGQVNIFMCPTAELMSELLTSEYWLWKYYIKKNLP